MKKVSEMRALQTLKTTGADGVRRFVHRGEAFAPGSAQERKDHLQRGRAVDVEPGADGTAKAATGAAKAATAKAAKEP